MSGAGRDNGNTVRLSNLSDETKESDLYELLQVRAAAAAAAAVGADDAAAANSRLGG